MRSVLAFGISSFIVQLALFREFLSIVSPNELTLSLLLCAWLLVFGLGALAGGRISVVPGFRGLHAFAALAPLATVCALRYTRNLAFGLGVQPGALPFFAYACLIAAAVCLVNGLFLATAWRTLDPGRRQSLYSLDAVGCMAGGLLFSLLLFRVPNVFITLAAAAMFHVWAMHVPGKIRKTETAVCLLCMLFPAVDMDTRTLARLYQGFTVTHQENSPYGAVRVLSRNNEEYIVQNTQVLGYANNTGAAEECVHLCLLQTAKPRAVLVVSGALCGTIAEVQKHSPARIDYIDPDPVLLSLAQKKGYIPSDPSVHAAAGDARRLIAASDHAYDAVIVQLSAPQTLGANRFYTREFFRAVKKTLDKNGVLALALPPVTASLGQETAARFAMLKATLQCHFSHVVFFPGLATVALAANRPLDTNAAALLQANNLSASLVTPSYATATYTPMRMAMVNAVAKTRAINSDFSPRLFLLYQKNFWDEFGFSPALLIAPLAALLFFFIRGPGARAFVVFSTGFSITGTELFLLTAFEIWFGTLYYAMSLLFTLFCAGLALGCKAGSGKTRLNPFALDCLIILFLTASLAVMVAPMRFLIAPLLFAQAFLAGYQFAVVLANNQGPFTQLYGADLFGGAIGSLVFGVLLFPLLGAAGALLTLAGVKILSLYHSAHLSRAMHT